MCDYIGRYIVVVVTGSTYSAIVEPEVGDHCIAYSRMGHHFMLG